jgi:hypothetical protein
VLIFDRFRQSALTLDPVSAPSTSFLRFFPVCGVPLLPAALGAVAFPLDFCHKQGENTKPRITGALLDGY